MPWNPEVYNKFKAERYAPYYDLVSLIKKKKDLSVIDLGCGTGEITRMLADSLPGSQVLGIDSSAEMLKEAAGFKKEGMEFRQANIEDFLSPDKKWDLVFSNAAIQWVENHEIVLPNIIKLVKEGGQMAIQIPSNHGHYSHLAIKVVAGKSPFKEALKGWIRTSPVLGIEAYSEILYKHNVISIHVFEKVYPHVLNDAADMVNWVSGTALVPYLERLPKELHKAFMDEYSKLLKSKFPGIKIFYPFKRTFIYGVCA